MATTRSLVDAVTAAAAAGRRPLLLFDFDGTLSPTVSRPERARLPVATRRTLGDLSAAGCQVGVISGRPLADLEGLIDMPGIWLSGSGGLEPWIDNTPVGRQRSVAGAATIAALARGIAPAIARLPGVWVERKPLGLTIHHRDATLDTVMAVRGLAASLRESAPGVRVAVCSLGVEISPFADVHKGTAVAEFVRAAGDGAVWLLYAGNDANDAEAMDEVTRRGGWVIAVGDTEFPARTRVSNPRRLRSLLGAIASALGSFTRGRAPSDGLR